MAGVSKERNPPLVGEHHSLMLTNKLLFEEWTGIFSSGRLTGATSWKRMDKPITTGQEPICLETLITAGLKPKRKGQIT